MFPFNFFSSKKKFPDGSVLWPSGRECYSYQGHSGEVVSFTVFYTEEHGEKQNLIVASSMGFGSDGERISKEFEREIIKKCKMYFEQRNEKMLVI